MHAEPPSPEPKLPLTDLPSDFVPPLIPLDESVVAVDLEHDLPAANAGVSATQTITPSEIVRHLTVPWVEPPHLRQAEFVGQALGKATPPMPATMPSRLGLDMAGYEIDTEVARGGMGVVYRARDTVLGRDLAVKVLQERYRNNADVVRRFIEEAQIAAQLQHPGVVPIHELGTFPDGRPYFTMKLVQGRTLASLLKERSDPGQQLPHFLKIFEQIAQTVAYAHSRGVIHRDLKPANIMVGQFGELQVMDWGLAKVVGSASDGMVIRTVQARATQTELFDHLPEGTQTGAIMGTPAYMPPEQACGKLNRSDDRSDVFSLGAILCQILTGSPPYVGDSVREVLEKAQAGDLFEALERLDRCDIDLDLLRVAKACLAFEPDARPRDAGEVAAAVSALTELRQQDEQQMLQRTAERAIRAVNITKRALRQVRRQRSVFAFVLFGLITAWLVGRLGVGALLLWMTALVFAGGVWSVLDKETRR